MKKLEVLKCNVPFKIKGLYKYEVVFKHRYTNGEEPRRMFMDVRMCECIVYMKKS